MCKKLGFLLAVLVLWSACPVPAANIIWVAEENVDAAGVPYDQGWIDLLTAQGHTVDDQRATWWQTLDGSKIDALEAADLIIVSRTTNSGNYAGDATEVTQWNSVTTPLMLLTGYLARSSRWQWINTTGISEYATETALQVVDGTHPIFTGVNVTSGQVDVIDDSVNSGQATFLTSATDVGNGTLIGTRLDDGNAWIVEWAAGTTFYSGTAEVAAGKRLFLSGAGGGGGQEAGSMNFTPDGQTMFLNAVAYMLGLDLNPGRASGPVPGVGETDVPRNVVLSWTPGEGTTVHDVYFGTAFADVNGASRTNPLGVLASQGQTAVTFDPDILLEFGQTYYWRVDEWDAGMTVYEGNVWSFEVEPLTYVVSDVTATASLPSPEGKDPNNTVNSSGLDSDGHHSMEDADSWQVKAEADDVVWIQFDFDRVYKLNEIQIWNYNFGYEFILMFGLKDVTVEYATDANEWVTFGDLQLSQGPSDASYAGETFDLAGIAARSVRITANSNYGGSSYALSEVRFRYIPAHPRSPQPDTGATDVAIDTVLSWRAGREAVSHDVSLGTDANAVAPVDTVATNAYDPGGLNLGMTYYWTVDEVNDAATPSVWASDLWNFTTQEYILIDGFEDYTGDEGNRVYQTWLDGYDYTPNGSVVGNDDPPFVEETVVYEGSQSMPLFYNNIDGVAYSEAEYAFTPARDLTANGADTLTLYHQGTPISLLIVSDSHIAMNGTGTDIWGTSDEGRFVYKQLTGDGTIVARVEGIDNTDPWAKGGVMIRQSLDADSAWAYAVISADSGSHFQARLTAGAEATSDTSLTLPEEQTDVEAPAWVKLERSGDTFNVYYATDEAGTAWVPNPWNPQTITMTGPVYIGVAVTSHNADAVAQGEFTQIATTGNVTGDWQSTSLGVDQPEEGNGVDRLYVTVEDSSGKAVTLPHPSPAAVGGATWRPWEISLSDISAAGVNTKSIKKLYIGVGDKTQPSQAAAGVIYIDNVGYGHPVDAE